MCSARESNLPKVIKNSKLVMMSIREYHSREGLQDTESVNVKLNLKTSNATRSVMLSVLIHFITL